MCGRTHFYCGMTCKLLHLDTRVIETHTSAQISASFPRLRRILPYSGSRAFQNRDSLHNTASRPEETMVARLIKRVAFLNLAIVLAASILASQPALAQNFITVDYPGGTLNSVRQINNHGVMAGRYVDSEGVYHGFVLQNGAFTAINFPGSLGTAVWGINDNGDVVGRYLDTVTNHGFFLSRGVYTPIAPPNPGAPFPRGIKNVGQIGGLSVD